MSCLPIHGRIKCKKCYSGDVAFNKSREENDGWRITANPLAWGNPYAEVVVLGFSKGPTQAEALEHTPHDDICFKGSRLNVGKIMAHVGLISKLPNDSDKLKQKVGELVANKDGRFHFGSLIRCTVKRFDEKENKWKGSGGNMLDKFVSTKFGQCVANNCTTEYLADLPASTKLVLMFGLGTKLNYVKEAFKLFKKSRPGTWRYLNDNDVAYTDEKITVVHVEHFKSQGEHIPNWLGEKENDRAKFGIMAQKAVASVINTDKSYSPV